MRRSHTAVVERGEPLSGEWATEPYEAGWAAEALVFVRVLEAPPGVGLEARVQLSPDGMHWLDEGTTFTELNAARPLGFARLREFGNWLRLAGSTGSQGAPSAPSGAQVRALIYIVLKE